MPWAKLCSTPQLQPCIGLFKCLDDEPRIEAYVWNALVDREKARIVRRPALCQVNALSSGRSSDMYRASSGCLKINPSDLRFRLVHDSSSRMESSQ